MPGQLSVRIMHRSMKIDSRKRKEKKAILLSFAFISFSESGLFNELRPIQAKKLRRFLRPMRYALNACLAASPRTSHGDSADIPGTEKTIAQVRYLGNDFDRLSLGFRRCPRSASVARSGVVGSEIKWGLAKTEAEIAERVARFLKAELKRADVTYEELAKRLKEHGLNETRDSIAAKLKRGTFAATFLLACLAAEGIRLEDL
jgi:Domain of unknown function (DUF6471)